MKSLLSSRPVLWLLFLFNAAVAVAVAVGGHHLHLHGQTLHGTQQLMTAVGMASSHSALAPPSPGAARRGPEAAPTCGSPAAGTRTHEAGALDDGRC